MERARPARQPGPHPTILFALMRADVLSLGLERLDDGARRGQLLDRRLL